MKKEYTIPQIAVIETEAAHLLAGTLITDKPSGDYGGRVNSKRFTPYFDDEE